MRLFQILFLSSALLVAMPGMAHQGAHGETQEAAGPAKPKPEQGAPGKPAPRPKRTALAEAASNERFCMKNREGKLHCIPFGAH